MPSPPPTNTLTSFTNCHCKFISISANIHHSSAHNNPVHKIPTICSSPTFQCTNILSPLPCLHHTLSLPTISPSAFHHQYTTTPSHAPNTPQQHCQPFSFQSCNTNFTHFPLPTRHNFNYYNIPLNCQMDSFSTFCSLGQYDSNVGKLR